MVGQVADKSVAVTGIVEAEIIEAVPDK
ncbi:MAG: hypothetical protein ACI9TZ_003321 [Yoonia sp.]